MPLIVDGSTAPLGPSGLPPVVTIGDFTIAQDMVDDHGVRWELNELDGWTVPTGSTGGMDQRASDHGGWTSQSYYTPRMIELRVSAHASSWRDVEAALDRLYAAVPISGLAPFVVELDGQWKQSSVRQAEAPELDAQNYLERAYVTLSLIAPDPRRYAVDAVTAETGLPQTTGGLSVPFTLPISITATSSSGVLAATNDGNFATRPTLTVYGPVEPFTITHRGTGQTLRYHEAIPAGRRLEIDTDKRRAMLDGTALRRLTGSWFEYAPGLNEVAFSASTYNPDARLTSEHRSAWR